VVTSTGLPTFLSCHLHAFEALGGLPEEILYDNQKQVVSPARPKVPASIPSSCNRSGPL